MQGIPVSSAVFISIFAAFASAASPSPVSSACDGRFADSSGLRPSIANGTFHLDGRPVFFLGPWIYNHDEEDWPKNNPDRQGVGHFAYRERPGKSVFERMGFNASQLSSAWALPGQKLYGLDIPADYPRREEEQAAFFRRFGDQPMVVDFAFGFDKALKRQRPELWRAIDQKNPHWHQFVPFCPEAPDGDRYYRAYIEGGVRSALEGGANVFLWELFNESSYMCQCPGNAAAFANEMESRFGTIGEANRVWGTDYADFAAVASETDFFSRRRLWPDYAKFLARRYAAILRGYSDFIRSIDRRGNVYFTEQSSVGTIDKARDSCMDYRLVADALDILAYEGGITYGRKGSKVEGASEMEEVVFGNALEHFFDLDFYQALTRGEKPMLNDELYCQRIEFGLRVPSRREDLATSHWAELFHGSSGAFSYCWAKRGWEWNDMEGARNMVERPSYKSAHLLNPYAWPPEALSGFKQFMDELEPFRDKILVFPRAKSASEPSVAIVFSYPTVRMLGHERMDYRKRLVRWHGAVLGAHYPVGVVFEEDLANGLKPGVRALLVPSARYSTPEGAAAVSRIAESGVAVIADRDAFFKDERGDPLPEPSPRIIRLDADSNASIPALLTAVAASGARRDATLSLVSENGDLTHPRPPRSSDIQVIDRGDFKFLYFVAMGEDSTRGGVLRWNINDSGSFFLSDPLGKRLLLNGASGQWDAAALSNGVFVAVPPQERVLYVLSREAPGDNYACIGETAMRALVTDAQAREAPELAEYRRRAKEADKAQEEARLWRDVDAARCVPVPIAASANMAFADDVAGDKRGGWFDQGSSNDFAPMPLGRHVLSGVPFDIADPASNDGRAAVVLYGTNRDFFPTEAPEIAVGLKAKSVYFLHAYGWDAAEGMPVLTYRIRYADGETEDFVCRARKEIGPWHGAQVATDAKLAIKADNTTLGKVNIQCARWINPRPGVEIKGVTPVSAKSPAVPVVVAITAEQ